MQIKSAKYLLLISTCNISTGAGCSRLDAALLATPFSKIFKLFGYVPNVTKPVSKFRKTTNDYLFIHAAFTTSERHYNKLQRNQFNLLNTMKHYMSLPEAAEGPRQTEQRDNALCRSQARL
jgi:hypothetical protein